MALAKIFTLSELIAPITRTEARDALFAIMSKVGINTTAWEPGAVVRTMVTANAAMFEALAQLQAEIAKSGFLEYAEGSWLRLIARHVYGVDPIDATFATGNVVLTNTGGGLYEVDAGDLIVQNPITGKTYSNAVSFMLGAGSIPSPSTVTVTVIAQEAGTASNANSGEITDFVTSLSRVTVTNPVALIAVDAESAPALRGRCKERLGALSPFGPWDAYSFAARNAKLSTGAAAGVTRTRVTRDGYGNLYLTAATASGGITGTVGDLATPLGAVDDAIQRQAAPLGITAHTVNATPLPITVSYQAWVYTTSGLTVDQVKQAVAKALQSLVSGTPIGGVKLVPADATGFVFTEAVTAAIHNAVPEIFRVALVLPAADLVLSATQVPVLVHNPETQAVITQVSPPEGTIVA